MNTYLIVQRNRGRGYEFSGPKGNLATMLFVSALEALSNIHLTLLLGYRVVKISEPDYDCPDERARGRSPLIKVTAYLPFTKWFMSRKDIEHFIIERANCVDYQGDHEMCTIKPREEYKYGVVK